MSCSIKDLHCAVYAILTGDAQLMALTTAVYNHVPQGQAVYPYTTIGRIDSNIYSTFDDIGDDMVYSVDIYGKSKSMAVIYDIAQRVKELLARQEDTISTVLCCIQSFNYGGIIENPYHNMEIEGRLITVEFNVKLL